MLVWELRFTPLVVNRLGERAQLPRKAIRAERSGRTARQATREAPAGMGEQVSAKGGRPRRRAAKPDAAPPQDTSQDGGCAPVATATPEQEAPTPSLHLIPRLLQVLGA